MSFARHFLPIANCFVLLLAAACSPAAASPLLTSTTTNAVGSPATLTAPPAMTSTGSSSFSLVTSSPTASPSALPASPTSTITPSLTPSPMPVLPSPTICPPDICFYADQFFLQRPILPPDNDVIDSTYRFGSTQSGMREPHHGIEMLNPAGTVVRSAADGIVVVAGGDIDPTSAHGEWPITFYGPYSNFYGNLVVIEHQAPAGLAASPLALPQPIYTLYAHLSVIAVAQGQVVQAGEEIGQVGMAGIATGNHLHFEVRLGANTYENVSNPELWLMPHQSEDGRPMGGLAGRVIDPWGNNIPLDGGIVLQHLPEGPDSPKDFEFYTMAYRENALIGRPPFYESFAIGDLPPGLYRVSFAYGGVRKFLVEVFPGALTVTEFRLDE